MLQAPLDELLKKWRPHMFELLRGYEPVADAVGTFYRPRVYSRVESDGRWSGWLVFFPVPPGRVISSGRETTQPTFDALVRWATTLSSVYLEGALQRALALEPEAELVDDLAQLYVIASAAREEAAVAKTSAEAYEISADLARAQAEVAERDASEYEATAAAVEEADATTAAEAHESAARAARDDAAAASRRKRMAKADAKAAAAATPRRASGKRK
jgi:hypothetical protein